MIDIHSHILPGIDDGSSDLYESLEMAELAVRGGTSTIVATPHCNIPGSYRNYYSEEYDYVFNLLQDSIKNENIDLQVLPGMEVFVTEDVPKLITEGMVIPINNTKYMLFEFGFGEEPDFVRYMLERIMDLGVKPVIAHAERFHFVHDNPHLLKEWKKKDIVIQMNKGSFQGRFGYKSEEIAFMAMDAGLVNVIASDAHGCNMRTPFMDNVYYELSADYKAEYLNKLFNDNPLKIITGRSIA